MKLKGIVLALLATVFPLVGNGKSYFGYGWSTLTAGRIGGLSTSSSSSSAGSKVFTYGDIVLEPEDSLSFAVEELPDEIGGNSVLGEYLPDGIEVVWTGRRFKVPAAGRVRYSKKDGDFVATKDDNPCGFKVSISKKGKVTGSFKVYAVKGEKTLKTYTAKVSGYLGGELAVSIKKADFYTVATLE